MGVKFCFRDWGYVGESQRSRGYKMCIDNSDGRSARLWVIFHSSFGLSYFNFSKY